MARKSTETNKRGPDEINNRLHEAIEGLRKDVTRVEIWATALSSFTQSVPDYSPSNTFELGQNSSEAPQKPEASAKADSADSADKKR